MGHSLSSVVNKPAYRDHKARNNKKWGFIVLAALGFLIVFYMVLFDSSLNAMGVGYYELSLPERAQFVDQLLNPLGAGVCILFILLLTGIAYRHATRHLPTFKPAQFQENDLLDAAGPAFISAGAQRITVVKNSRGFLRILLPVFPSSKDHYFIDPAEKVDQVISLQANSLHTDVHCRTKDGIPILLPNISLEYAFSISDTAAKEHAAPDKKEELDKVKNYLLRKGNLSSDALVLACLTNTLVHALRKINLDDLKGTSPLPSFTTGEADTLPGTVLKRYKVLSLKKHWLVIHQRKNSDMVHRALMRKDHPPSRSRIMIRRTPVGDHLFSTHEISRKNDIKIQQLDLESRIRRSLARELHKYQIELKSLQLQTWQPVEPGIQQKIQQAQHKSAALFSDEQRFSARTIQLQAKEEHLRFLIAQTNPAVPLSEQERALAFQQVLKQAVQYGIPISSISKADDTEYHSQQNDVDPTQKG